MPHARARSRCGLSPGRAITPSAPEDDVGAGLDSLTGGEGYDSLHAGDDDTLHLSDLATDYGDCGLGSDTAYVDPGGSS